MSRAVVVFGPGLRLSRAQSGHATFGSAPSLAVLCSLGLPVPFGFSLSSPDGRSGGLRGRLEAALRYIERGIGRPLSDPACPHLLWHQVDGGGAEAYASPRSLPLGAASELLPRLLALCADEPGGMTAYALPVTSSRRLSIICWEIDPGSGRRRMGGEYAACSSPAELRRGEVEARPLRTLLSGSPTVAARLRALRERLRAGELRFHELEIVLDQERLLVVGACPPALGALAALRFGVREVLAGSWSRERAVAFMPREQAEALGRPAPQARGLAALPVVAKGKGVAQGIGYGRVVFSTEAARLWDGARSKVVLFSARVGREELEAVGAGGAIVGATTGVGSCAARLARLRGIPMVGGVRVGDGQPLCPEGSWVAVDGRTGRVYLGEPPLRRSQIPQEMERLLEWAGEICRRRGLRFRVNADTAAELRTGIAAGAGGVGLCRTERLLAEPRPLELLRRSIVAPETGERQRALALLGAAYRRSFRSLLESAGGRPVTIRLLDPTLGELLPEEGEEAARLARRLDLAPRELLEAARGYRAANPVLGLRGCRVGLLRPELYDMQLAALFEAACALRASGRRVSPEILLPFVSTAEEAAALRERVEEVSSRVMSRRGVRVRYLVGAMVELPRAALRAEELARRMEFLCLGTNDLTAMTLGVSREDVGGFLSDYLARGIWREDPFRTLDEGVVELLRTAVTRARRGRSGIGIGICGEHAGDAASIRRLFGAGASRIAVDYLSCSSSRLPAARLAAAQALLDHEAAMKASRRSRAP